MALSNVTGKIITQQNGGPNYQTGYAGPLSLGDYNIRPYLQRIFPYPTTALPYLTFYMDMNDLTTATNGQLDTAALNNVVQTGTPLVGTRVGSTGWITGATAKTGAALNCNSIDYVNIAKDSRLVGGATAFSLAIWLQVPSYPAALTLRAARYGNVSSTGYELSIAPVTGVISFSGVTAGAVTTAAAIGIATWAHYVFTFAYPGNITVYKNGSATGDTAATTGPLVDSGSQDLFIGAEAAGLARPWLGYIDEVMIFSKELTSGEVSTLYGCY